MRYTKNTRRGDRAVEGARLERVCASNRTQGSNPCLSARKTTELFLEGKSEACAKDPPRVFVCSRVGEISLS